MSDDAIKENYQRWLQEAATELSLPITHDRVRLKAYLRASLEAEEIRVVSGLRPDPSLALKLHEALSQYAPAKQTEVIPFRVDTIMGVVGMYNCKFCGAMNELPEGEFTPAPERDDNAKLPRTIEGGIVADAKQSAARAEPQPEPKPEPPKQFHPATDFHAGAPLRNGNEPWRAHVRGNG